MWWISWDLMMVLWRCDGNLYGNLWDFMVGKTGDELDYLNHGDSPTKNSGHKMASWELMGIVHDWWGFAALVGNQKVGIWWDFDQNPWGLHCNDYTSTTLDDGMMLGIWINMGEDLPIWWYCLWIFSATRWIFCDWWRWNDVWNDVWNVPSGKPT